MFLTLGFRARHSTAGSGDSAKRTTQWQAFPLQPQTTPTPTPNAPPGFCIPRTQWSITPADAVDCPPQTYLQQQNGATVCARTDCAGPVGTAVQPGAQQQSSSLVAAAYVALKKSMPQVWGGSSASICSTITVKPIMRCQDGCISDVR